MAKKKIFTSDEVFNVYKAFASAEADSSADDILSIYDEEAYEKMGFLSKSDHKEFIEKINISVQELSGCFNGLSEKVETEEECEEQQTDIQSIYNYLTDFLEDFIKDDD